MAKKKTAAKESVQLSVRITPAELASFHAAADEYGLKVSDWVRQTLRRASGLKAFGGDDVTGPL